MENNKMNYVNMHETNIPKTDVINRHAPARVIFHTLETMPHSTGCIYVDELLQNGYTHFVLNNGDNETMYRPNIGGDDYASRDGVNFDRVTANYAAWGNE